MRYEFRDIEKKWQESWAHHGTFRAENPWTPGFDATKPKYYVLDMFPYPSGVGLHVGHPLGYIATDIVSRYKRMKGFNVLHPMGYDAFGLPAEQFAVEHGVHPRVTTEKNIANMTRQLKRLGLSYDWDRCLATTDEGYYRWTQWIFLQLFHSCIDPATRRAIPIREILDLLDGESYYIGLDGELVPAGATQDISVFVGDPIGLRKWHELDQAERTSVIESLRLAYIAEVPVNWCPQLGTVLANEEVTNEGRSERGNFPVFKRPMRQWMLRITAMADRLDGDLDHVAWPEPTKLMQRNWIGRSEGARVDFEVARTAHLSEQSSEEADVITVFTTRPDTLFGATYMVLAPEHPLVEEITTPEQYHAVNEYKKRAAAKSDVERQAEAASGAKTGVFTGAHAINPVNQQKIPIWIADYVMMGYGTGAIMAVPGHDERDFAFAKQFGLPVVEVVASAHGQGDLSRPASEPSEAFTGTGTAINSANDEISLNGLPTDEAKKKITAWLESKGVGKKQVQYKLRDWLFSRQRYWGEPFPILHGPNGEIVAVDESDLPVLLPEMEDFRPAASDDPDALPQPPLGRAPDSWKYVEKNGVRYARELNTMPQWAGSCWYYLRFCDPHNAERFVGSQAEQYWMVSKKKSKVQSPKSKVEQEGKDTGHGTLDFGLYHAGGVDLYVGGVEHAVLHLLYARFWHKVLFDLGHVSTPEPFGRLFNQGYIQAYAYTDSRGIYVPAEEVEEKGDKYIFRGQEVRREHGKMGKSLKNAVAPDEIAEQYGCDTLRLYEMYMGPLDQSKVWNTRDIAGPHRFLQRVWRNYLDEETGKLLVTDDAPSDALLRLLHKTIKRVTDTMESMAFNVAIAALIELNNELVGLGMLPRAVAEPFVLMLAPMAPHIAEELWSRLGHDESLAYEPWPIYDEKLLVEDEVEYPVQINGKLRGRIKVPATADEQSVEAAAVTDEKVLAALEGKKVKKVIVIKGRMVNIVAG